VTGGSFVLGVINSATSSSTVAPGAVINNNVWNHFVWTLSPDGTWRIYLNGTLNNTYTGRLYPTIGDRNTNSWGTGFDNALIDEFQQYNRVLVLAEVQSIYAGTVTYNSGSNPAVVATDSKFGTKSLYFPGTTYSGAVALNPITLTDPSAVSISAWVKFNSLDSNPRTIFSMANTTDSIRFAATSNNYVIYRGDLSYNVPVTPTTGAWTHLVASNSNLPINNWIVSINKNQNLAYFKETRFLSILWLTSGNSIVYLNANNSYSIISSIPFFNSIISVSYQNNAWYARGSGPIYNAAYSLDGSNWTGLIDSNSYSAMSAYGNNIWVKINFAVGGFSYSSNFNTTAGNVSYLFTYTPNGIVFGNGIFVASGYSFNGSTPTLAYSYNGINWTLQPAGIVQPIGLIFSNGVFVAYGSSVYLVTDYSQYPVYYSLNGTSWSPVNGLTRTVFSVVRTATYGNGKFVLGGNNLSNNAVIAVSSDGINYTVYTFYSYTAIYNIWFSNGIFVAFFLASSYYYATSTDGANWINFTISTSSPYAQLFSDYANPFGSSINTRESFNYGPITYNIPSTNTNNTYSKAAIGMDASSNTMKMDGYIDDLRIYNSALSSTQVAQIYDGRADPNTLVSYYTFDSESRNIAGNLFANYATGAPVYDAVLGNTSLFTISGERMGSGCLSFPSTSYSGNVQLGNVSLLDTSAVSIATWVNFASLDATPRTVMCLGNTTTSKSIFIRATSTFYNLVYRVSNVERYVRIGTPTTNSWTHIVGTISNGATNTWNLYINGVSNAFTTDMSSVVLPTVDLAPLYNNNGAGYDTVLNNNKMHGFIDETRIYNRALSTTEVLSLIHI
jgi:hypothetical protein